MILGVRVEGVGLWEGGRAVGAVAYVLVAALVVTSAVLVAIRRPDAWILVLALALYPLLYAAFPTSWFWNDGRYGLSLTPILSLVIAGGLWQMARPKIAVWLASALLVLACVSTLVAFNDGYGAIGTPSKLSVFTANPNTDVTALTHLLDHLGVSHAYAGYWVANNVTFVSNGRITALALDENRNPPGASNADANGVAWVFVPDASIGPVSSQLGSVTDLNPGTITEAQFTAWLKTHGVPYRHHSIAGFDVVIPQRTVSPAAVAR